MHRPAVRFCGAEDGIVYRTVHKPSQVVRRSEGRQVIAVLHNIVQSPELPYGLAVILVYPFLGAVGAYHNQGYLAVISFGNGRCIVQQGSP